MKWFDRVKEHVKRNKTAYIAGGITGGTVLVAGVLGAMYISSKNANIELIDSDINVVPINIKPVINNNNTYQTVSMYGNPIGRPGKAVVDMTTMKRFESETLAAKAIGVSPVMMSNHLNGKMPDVEGRVLKFVEDA